MTEIGRDALPPPITLTRMKVPKASDVLATELRERILSGEYREGVSLPAERDLVVQTGLSRTTVREALRILEVQGLIRIKAGRAGGAFVQRPGEQAMASTVEHIIRGRQITLSALLETREIIEPFAARLAAKNKTPAQLEALDRANVTMADPAIDLAQTLDANVEWHVAVARASNNNLLSGLMVALSNAIYEATDNAALADGEARALAVAAHRTTTEAIRAGDEDAASRRMERHVHAYVVEARARMPGTGDGTVS